MNVSIETDRLLFRAPINEDIIPIYEIQSDPIAMKYTIITTSINETEKRIQDYERERTELGFAPWTIILKEENRVIGWGGLNIDPYDPGWGVEVIYYFHPGYWGRGFGTELVKISIEKGFTDHKLKEIHAFAHPNNKASIKVLEKNGFTFQCYEVKLSRNHYVIVRE